MDNTVAGRGSENISPDMANSVAVRDYAQDFSVYTSSRGRSFDCTVLQQSLNLDKLQNSLGCRSL
jgi:hypothetical protein